jgi:hypothetical protein
MFKSFNVIEIFIAAIQAVLNLCGKTTGIVIHRV